MLNSSTHAEARRARKTRLKGFINQIKSGPCTDCGNRYLPEAMHFDHRPGVVKVRCISELFYRVASIELILNEIAKCDLVCVGCHRSRTQSRIVPMSRYSCLAHAPGGDPNCRKCKTSELVRIRKIELRLYLESLKQGPCVDCGRQFTPTHMDFDHRDKAGKMIDLSSAVSSGWSKPRLGLEIRKCDLVCCWCHVYRTEQRRAA